MNAILKPFTADKLVPAGITEFSKPQLIAPRCPAGQIEYLHMIQGPNEILVCHLEYEPAERGVQIEPDYPAVVNLVAAYHRGGDVMALLGSEVVEEIEAMALAEAVS